MNVNCCYTSFSIIKSTIIKKIKLRKKYSIYIFYTTHAIKYKRNKNEP